MPKRAEHGSKAASGTRDGAPFRHVNRKGVEYFLHEGRTKTGKPRYFFARTIRAGALTRMPRGYEVAESVNGVVSVCRSRASQIDRADLARVEAALRRHPHLMHHRATIGGDAIVIHAPDRDEAYVADVARTLSVPIHRLADLRRSVLERARYSPVFQFVRDDGGWIARRMTFRGDGGWSWPLDSGSLSELVERFVPTIGTDAFFELM